MPDLQPVRRDIFDILQMFGPANAGGPPQANTNPGTRDQPQPDLAAVPPPPAQAPPVAQAPPEIAPVGVRTLPPATPITPNGGEAGAAAAAADARQKAIELLPGDADPNLLPPALRDSPLFRYYQAQRVAQFKQAQEDARWTNVVGGVGNIARILSGQAPTYQAGAAHAETPGALKLDDLRNLSADIAKAEKDKASAAALDQAAKDMAKYTGEPVEVMKAIIAAKPEKLADIASGRIDINDDEKERLRINKDLEARGQRPINPLEWHTMKGDEKIRISAAQGQGSPGKGFTEALVKDTVTAIEVANKARDQMTPTQGALRTITDPNSKLWVNGFYGDPTVQGAAKFISGAFGADMSGITDAETLRARVGQLVMDNAKAFGGQPSEGERQAVKEVIGADGRLNRAALETIMRENLRRQVAAQVTAAERIRESGTTFADDPRSQTYLRVAAEKLGDVPDLTREIFGDPVVAALVANPSPEVRRDFDKRYGAGMSAYVLAKRGGGGGG